MKRTMKWASGSVLLLIEVSLAILVGTTLFFVLALFLASPILLTLAGVAAAGFIAGGLARLTARWLAPGNRRRLGWWLGLGTALLLLLAAGVFLFRPRSFDPPRQVLDAELRYETLSTGSRLACRVLPARGATRRGGVIFLHGGPGSNAATHLSLVRTLSPLTDLGYDVCLYDQIGGGLSDRLDDPARYTAARHVADLEALRRRLGWEEPVLIGKSWGAQLIARYAAEHPRAVGAAVLVSPGPLRPADWADREPGSAMERVTEEQLGEFYSVLDARLVTAMLLFRINPAAAYRFLPQAEADAYGADLLAALAPGAVCDPAALSGESPAWLNLWAAQTTVRDMKREPANRLGGLASSRFPVLVIRGDCDYGHEEIAGEYVDAFPAAELAAIPDAGHFLLLERPEGFLAVVEEFLRTRVVPETDPDQS